MIQLNLAPSSTPEQNRAIPVSTIELTLSVTYDLL